MVNLDDDDKLLLTDDDDSGLMDGDLFAQMVEDSLSGMKEGDVVTGRVIEITPVGVVLDIGYKAEGEIPLDEFMDLPGGLEAINPGDEFEVVIESRFMDGDEETLLLSRRRAGEVQAWENIEKAYKSDGTIEGTVVSRVKGGLRVDVGVPAFLPGSQVDLRPVRDLDSLIGKKFDYRVLKYSRQRRNVVLSRRAILEEVREKLKTKLLATLEEGQVLEGVVKNVVKYGAFIDLGGMDGLLHVSDMSWGRIQHPGDLVRVGDNLKVRVLKFDRAKGRISLGLKQLTPDPWAGADERYPVGKKISGKVVNVVDYGAFVEIEPGLEGLVHVSEISWTENIRQADAVLSEEEEIEAMVLSLDTKARKLALSLKRLEADPWGEVAEAYPAGTIIESKIKSVTDFGLFVGLDRGVDGLIRRKDISWATDLIDPAEDYETGQMIQAMVLSIDQDKKRVALGIKQLTESPWPGFMEKVSLGQIMDGQVSGIIDQSILVRVSEEILGRIELEEGQEPESLGLAAGDQVQVRVLSMNPDDSRLEVGLVSE